MDYDQIIMAATHHGIDPALGQALETPPPTEETPPPTGGWFQDYLAQAKQGWADWWEQTGKGAVGWPAPVPVRPERWIETPSGALWQYRVALGDTYSGLAGTYLGSPSRWKEIWDVQPDTYRWTHSPDVLGVDEVINMPDEARDNLLNWIKQGKPGTIKPGDLPPETIGQKGRRLAPYILAIGGAGALGYFLLRG